MPSSPLTSISPSPPSLKRGVVRSDEAVSRRVARTDFVEVDHVAGLARTADQQRARGGARRRQPHWRSHDLLPDPRADRGIFVLPHFGPIDHLAPPTTDGRPIASDRDLLALVVGEEREHRAPLHGLRALFALVVVRELVPDIAAVDDNGEIACWASSIPARGALESPPTSHREYRRATRAK